ncbi:sodium ion-translocating decarboxylase subunit beta [Lacticaseibacillus paracasei]|jgi:carboxybiotin decarboxylase|uniref:Oxaloacetate decarboxylase beta chain n=2 Tax=Lacticaseibacillus paracasei subsp. paracasei TaxID=47714 RepID=A0A8E0IBX3_LACPA|nr:sodium ion-translocating decarboxylase subunit beta [Lacticaseibacillus paracasei]EPC31268.1 Oxaloacetate decarboxylase beta chain [Lacticaseibacillus paracasei subsp. paracasei Lpp22]ATG99237.1 glutaconyl-CoA decarboxylase subunit beta [Lacticaseibacillus paracasei]MBB1167529.1 sodium ion-translocating decarboxylase subunit beta [Lacticaseibacillus paracasei]MBU6047148.1 sodium ion-translocating decarboxylase subunit beta [Lacticaseibacillus paracasei]MCL4971965.1 sodium ion-translocating 
MEALIHGITTITLGQIAMMLIGALLMYLGIKKEYEPTLLVPMGLGAILVNFPGTGVLTQVVGGTKAEGVLDVLFKAGINTELFPLLIFIGIGAMIDFGPLLQNPFMLLFGAAAQFGIFATVFVAVFFGFNIKEAASIGIIGAADGPTSIFVSNQLAPNLLGAITVAAYSYMALVPIIQPMAIKAVTTKHERRIRMTYKAEGVSKTTKILFPIIITIIAGFIAPISLPLVGFLMFGNLLRECGVLDRLSNTAQNELVNIVSILLGLTISVKLQADQFLNIQTLMIIAFGLFAFIMDSVGGVLFAKLLNLFRKDKINPMIGAAGISAFPMSSRVIQTMATDEDPQNFVLMYAVGANVSGQIGSVIAGGLLLSFFGA